MKNKALIIVTVITALAVVISGGWWIFFRDPPGSDGTHGGAQNTGYPAPALTIADIDTNDISVSFRAAGDYFYNLSDKKWTFTYLKGVNMGLTEATTDLANPNVSYETYLEWFGQIAKMNANTVKIFTVMPPQFYSAFHDYNAKAANLLYLIQGIWFSEDMMYNYDNAYDDDEAIGKAFKRASLETVDIIHGNNDYTDYGEIKNAVYKYDVSKYVAGYILGLEWEPYFVKRTNELPNKVGYSGKYLKTAEKATAFESFLCSVGDYLIDYETKTYSAQTPVAFLNWATTDTLTHTNEPFEEEDVVSVNTENIVSTAEYYPGLFAAIDVYPYYPEFMNHQPEYLKKDSDGNVDTYRAYLNELKTTYSVPVIIAEFGVPTSRGAAHEAVTGMNQGKITEQQQGEYAVKMAQDIAKEGYAGSMIFSWQDEWFKQTWNTVKYAPDDASKRTPNVQSAEQSYGILAMEPGKTAACIIDGNVGDWANSTVVSSSGSTTVSAKWDETYLYLKIGLGSLSFDKDTAIVPIKISGLGSKSSSQYNVAFGDNTDFLLVINGKNNTRVLCDAYEDTFYYQYSVQKGVFPADATNEKRNSSKYNKINQFLSNEIVLPLTGETIKPKYYESGLLTYGIADPASSDYNSLADFYCKNGTVEVRIPWYLLNVMNSTNASCIGDFHQKGEIAFTSFDSINIGIGTPDSTIQLSSIGYSAKSKSEFHTRLKKSYDIICDGLSELMVF